MKEWLSWLIAHPITSAVSGTVLFASGFDEFLEQSGVEALAGGLGMHHGLIFVGGLQALRGLMEALEGASKLVEGPPTSEPGLE